MSFLRKTSLSRKKDREGSESPKAQSIRGEKPPKAAGVSSIQDEESPKPKRKGTLTGKGRKRLSSLFSSSSLSSYNSDREPSASPAPSSKLSKLNNISTSSSGASTPTRDTSISSSRPYAGLEGKGLPTDVNRTAEGVKALNISSGEPLTASPESSPTATTAPGPPHGPTHDAAVEGDMRRKRSPSLYSQWDLAEAAEESSGEEDNDAFLTPSEGLSEVEEEAEEEETTPANQTFAATNVHKGAKAAEGDVAGTGSSTIKRSTPAAGETKVKRRLASTKAAATSIDQAKSLASDMEICREALTLFLSSRMREAEDLLLEKDPEGVHLYLISAHGIINGLKGMMTFDSNDLAAALDITKATYTTATALRKPSDSIATRIGGLVKSGTGVARIKSMTPLERHAELVYAETSLMKALLAIVAGGDWLGLVREALNMRTAHGIYRTLQLYLDDADKSGFDEDIDMDFRSGVSLGSGTNSLMFSLLPSKVLRIAELFGYAGDRDDALKILLSAGGWSKDADVPEYDERNEGLRRPVCDMILLAFHLVISLLMPVDGVDIPMARKILAYNMRRYPNGVFFLYFQARLHTAQCEPELANKSLQQALDLQLEYVQLQHMCLWDYALNYFQLSNWKGALDCFNILKEESNWSRAVYTYSAAACLVELAEEGDRESRLAEADRLMKLVPKLTKKIAGKSLPIEKLASRKTRKFESQGHRLFLPAMELAYVFGALGHCPKYLLLEKHLPRINQALEKLEKVVPEEYGNGQEYWDDYCLGHFLRGFVQLIARYQPDEAAKEASRPVPGAPSDDEIDRGAEKDFQAVITHGPDIVLDHYIIYHCHYELGRLYARRGEKEQARKNFDVVMSGKLLEVNQHEKKAQGKYSLEGALLLKTHAALQGLNKGEVV